ncbi:MAG: hypothetical protein KC619_22790 [Myxococcales bacterium]|nr:hypothetical protein [Myxococcales bacterium]
MADVELLKIVAPLALAESRALVLERALRKLDQPYSHPDHRDGFYVARAVAAMINQPPVSSADSSDPLDLVGELRGGDVRYLNQYLRARQDEATDAMVCVEHLGMAAKNWLTSGAMFFAQAVFSARDDSGTHSDPQLHYGAVVARLVDLLASTRCGRQFGASLVDRVLHDRGSQLSETDSAIAYFVSRHVAPGPSTLSSLRRARTLASGAVSIVKLVYRTDLARRYVARVASILNGVAGWLRGRGGEQLRARLANIQFVVVSRYRAAAAAAEFVLQPIARDDTHAFSVRALDGILKYVGFTLDWFQLVRDLDSAFAEDRTVANTVRAGVFIGGDLASMGAFINGAYEQRRGLRLDVNGFDSGWYRGLSTVASVLGLAGHVIESVEARQEDQSTVAAGYAISAVSDALKIAEGLLAWTGVSSSFGPLGMVALGLGLAGWVICSYMRDTDLQQFVRYSVVGRSERGRGGHVRVAWSDQSLHELRLHPGSQRRALINLLYSFRIRGEPTGLMRRALSVQQPARGTIYPRELGMVDSLVIECGSFDVGEACFEVAWRWSWMTPDALPTTSGGSSRLDGEVVTLRVYPGLRPDGSVVDMSESPGRPEVRPAGDSSQGWSNARKVVLIGGAEQAHTSLLALAAVHPETHANVLVVLPVATEARRLRAGSDRAAPVRVEVAVQFDVGNGLLSPVSPVELGVYPRSERSLDGISSIGGE